MDDFSSRLRRLRKDRDVTQAQLAAQVGVEPSAVGKYENGAQAYPRVEVLVKIADYFNVSIDYLIKGARTDHGTIVNDISGTLSNSHFIQANHGGIVFNGETSKALTPEAAELLRIYEVLGGRERLRLLSFAVEMERGAE